MVASSSVADDVHHQAEISVLGFVLFLNVPPGIIDQLLSICCVGPE
jgi:hypothetical protein